jgi:hypothetical protein
MTLRTGVDGGNPYAFVTLYQCGGPSPQLTPSYPSEVVSLDGIHAPQTITDSDGPLAGLAVAAPAAIVTVTAHNGSGTASNCIAPLTCNITGADTQTLGAGTAAAAVALAAAGTSTITENVCTVNVDPRAICPPGIPSSPYYNSRTLPIKAVCPNFTSPAAGPSVLPDYLCGAYGPGGAGTGTGFGVIQGIASAVNVIPGLLNLNDENPDAFFPPGGTSECSPDGVFVDNISDGWGPLFTSGVEGIIPEGNHLIELTTGCGGDKQPTAGMSLMVVGTALELNNATQELGNLPKTLANFAEYKYFNLGVELAEDPIDLQNKVRLLEIITQSALFLAGGKNGCAEDTLYEADRYVINNATHFHGVPAIDPNAYGRTRARILNLFYTLYTRLDGNINPISPTGTPLNLIIDDPLLAPSLTGPPSSCSSRYLGPDGY